MRPTAQAGVGCTARASAHVSVSSFVRFMRGSEFKVRNQR